MRETNAKSSCNDSEKGTSNESLAATVQIPPIDFGSSAEIKKKQVFNSFPSEDNELPTPYHKNLVSTIFHMEGINCNNCVRLIIGHLEHYIGVVGVNVNIVFGRVSIIHDADIVTVSDLVVEFEELGFVYPVVCSDLSLPTLKHFSSEFEPSLPIDSYVPPLSHYSDDYVKKTVDRSYTIVELINPITSSETTQPVISTKNVDSNVTLASSFYPYIPENKNDFIDTNMIDNGSYTPDTVSPFEIHNSSSAGSTRLSDDITLRHTVGSPFLQIQPPTDDDQCTSLSDYSTTGSHIDFIIVLKNLMDVDHSNQLHQTRNQIVTLLSNLKGIEHISTSNEFIRVFYDPEKIGARSIMNYIAQYHSHVKHCQSISMIPIWDKKLDQTLEIYTQTSHWFDVKKHDIKHYLLLSLFGIMLLMLILFISSIKLPLFKNISMVIGLHLFECVIGGIIIIKAGVPYKILFFNYVFTIKQQKDIILPSQLKILLWPVLWFGLIFPQIIWASLLLLPAYNNAQAIGYNGNTTFNDNNNNQFGYMSGAWSCEVVLVLASFLIGDFIHLRTQDNAWKHFYKEALSSSTPPTLLYQQLSKRNEFFRLILKPSLLKLTGAETYQKLFYSTLPQQHLKTSDEIQKKFIEHYQTNHIEDWMVEINTTEDLSNLHQYSTLMEKIHMNHWVHDIYLKSHQIAIDIHEQLLEIGDIIIIMKNQSFPVDGIVLERFKESVASFVVVRHSLFNNIGTLGTVSVLSAGDIVFSGGINLGDPVLIKVIHIGRNTSEYQFNRLLTLAMERKQTIDTALILEQELFEKYRYIGIVIKFVFFWVIISLICLIIRCLLLYIPIATNQRRVIMNLSESKKDSDCIQLRLYFFLHNMLSQLWMTMTQTQYIGLTDSLLVLFFDCTLIFLSMFIRGLFCIYSITLGLAVPITVKAANYVMSLRGIAMKHPSHTLQCLSIAKKIILEKTGILSEGRFRLCSAAIIPKSFEKVGIFGILHQYQQFQPQEPNCTPSRFRCSQPDLNKEQHPHSVQTIPFYPMGSPNNIQETLTPEEEHLLFTDTFLQHIEHHPLYTQETKHLASDIHSIKTHQASHQPLSHHSPDHSTVASRSLPSIQRRRERRAALTAKRMGLSTTTSQQSSLKNNISDSHFLTPFTYTTKRHELSVPLLSSDYSSLSGTDSQHYMDIPGSHYPLYQSGHITSYFPETESLHQPRLLSPTIDPNQFKKKLSSQPFHLGHHTTSTPDLLPEDLRIQEKFVGPYWETRQIPIQTTHLIPSYTHDINHIHHKKLLTPSIPSSEDNNISSRKSSLNIYPETYHFQINESTVIPHVEHNRLKEQIPPNTHSQRSGQDQLLLFPLCQQPPLSPDISCASYQTTGGLLSTLSNKGPYIEPMIQPQHSLSHRSTPLIYWILNSTDIQLHMNLTSPVELSPSLTPSPQETRRISLPLSFGIHELSRMTTKTNVDQSNPPNTYFPPSICHANHHDILITFWWLLWSAYSLHPNCIVQDINDYLKPNPEIPAPIRPTNIFFGLDGDLVCDVNGLQINLGVISTMSGRLNDYPCANEEISPTIVPNAIDSQDVLSSSSSSSVASCYNRHFRQSDEPKNDIYNKSSTFDAAAAYKPSTLSYDMQHIYPTRNTLTNFSFRDTSLNTKQVTPTSDSLFVLNEDSILSTPACESSHSYDTDNNNFSNLNLIQSTDFINKQMEQKNHLFNSLNHLNQESVSQLSQTPRCPMSDAGLDSIGTDMSDEEKQLCMSQRKNKSFETFELYPLFDKRKSVQRITRLQHVFHNEGNKVVSSENQSLQLLSRSTLEEYSYLPKNYVESFSKKIDSSSCPVVPSSVLPTMMKEKTLSHTLNISNGQRCSHDTSRSGELKHANELYIHQSNDVKHTHSSHIGALKKKVKQTRKSKLDCCELNNPFQLLDTDNSTGGKRLKQISILDILAVKQSLKDETMSIKNVFKHLGITAKQLSDSQCCCTKPCRCKIGYVNSTGMAFGSEGMSLAVSVNTPFFDVLEGWNKRLQLTGHHIVCLQANNVCIGAVAFKDVLRSSAADLISTLQKTLPERDIWLCTNEDFMSAQEAAENVGIRVSHVVSCAMPKDKVELILRLMNQTPSTTSNFNYVTHHCKRPIVCYIGNQMVDALACLTADIGIGFKPCIAKEFSATDSKINSINYPRSSHYIGFETCVDVLLPNTGDYNLKDLEWLFLFASAFERAQSRNIIISILTPTLIWIISFFCGFPQYSFLPNIFYSQFQIITILIAVVSSLILIVLSTLTLRQIPRLVLVPPTIR